MPRLRSLPEQAIMRDLYRTHPGTCKPLGELTETAMRGPSPFIAAAVYEVGWGDDALRKAGGNAEVEALDVSNAASVQRVAQAILGRHRRIDVLVNSAGLNNLQRFWRDQTVESWDQVIRINLDGTFYCTHAVLPSMRERKDGVVINISSWAGKYTSAMVGAAYNGSKHAVISLTETINMEEYVNGIRACAICPAEVATPILDSRPIPPSAEERAKMLQPDDLGAAIRWVAEQPAHVCVNEITISPTWNRIYIGAPDMKQR